MSPTIAPHASIATQQRFRFLKQFNLPEFSKKIGCRDRLRQSDIRWFPGEYLSSEFARALCEHRAVPFKEVLESFEFYACVRKQLGKSKAIADLCCGHGMVGIVFAMMERKVESVMLLDKRMPDSFDAVLSAAKQVAPWVADKIRYVECPLKKAQSHLEDSPAILGVHACGTRTDQCLSHAIRGRSPLALLPCCRDYSTHQSPSVLKQMLDPDVAVDIDRTYKLFNANYHVRWDHISAEITPMNRVIVGLPNDD